MFFTRSLRAGQGWQCLPLIALLAGVQSPLAAAEPAAPVVPMAAGDVHMTLEGPVRVYLDALTRNWLLPAPEANPALLAMFSNRDRAPYRDLLPWSGEFAGKYLTGATQVLRVSGDPRLRSQLQNFVAELVSLQDPDGYLGPFPAGHHLTGSAPNIGGKNGATWDAWGHYHVLLGLLLWHDATGDPNAMAAARKIGDLLCATFLGEKRPRLVDTGSTEMNLAPAHGLCLLYDKTGEKRYLDLARQLVGEFAATDDRGLPLAGDYLRRGLAGEEFYRLPKPRWESLHPVLALAALSRIDADSRSGEAFRNLWWSIARLDRHNNGGFSSGEQAQGNPYHPGAIETCCTIAWMAMTVEMLRLTGDSIAADELELSTFNSGLGLFSPSGRWSTYNTPMDGDRKANFHEIGFQCRPGSPELNCCSVNAARGLGLLSEWAVMRTPRDDGLVLNWYGPGRLQARLARGAPVELAIQTDYPRTGLVKIRVSPGEKSSFRLRLRIPHWSTRTIVKLNGDLQEGAKPGTYLDLNRAWTPGDLIALELDLTLHAWAGEQQCAGRASLYRGPILLTYDPRFNPGRGSDPDTIDLSAPSLPLTSWNGGQPPIVLVRAATEHGAVALCDFASAGFDGTAYRSWLRVTPVRAVPFSREHPWRSGPIGRDH